MNTPDVDHRKKVEKAVTLLERRLRFVQGRGILGVAWPQVVNET